MEQTDNEVRVEDEAGIDKPVLLGVTRRSEHKIGFGLLIGKRNSSGTIGKTADDDLVMLADGIKIAVGVIYH